MGGGVVKVFNARIWAHFKTNYFQHTARYYQFVIFTLTELKIFATLAREITCEPAPCLFSLLFVLVISGC